jgi:hypothetical protein
MNGDLKSLLWSDLAEVQARLDKTLATLRALQNAIETGVVDQPSRQDSNRLNRLMVLAELLCSEVAPWTNELNLTLLPSNGNGRSTPAVRPNGRGLTV